MGKMDEFYVYLVGAWALQKAVKSAPFIEESGISVSIAQTECTSAFSKVDSFMPDLLIGSVTKKLELESCSSDYLSLASF